MPIPKTPYKIAYPPVSRIKQAVASWYGEDFFGCKTANGEIYNGKDLTFAHQSLPFGTRVRFFYKDKQVIARCNDRGPFIEGRDFDLGYATAQFLELTETGVDTVMYEILPDEPKRRIGGVLR